MFERLVSGGLACCCTAALIACIPAVQDGATTRPATANGESTATPGEITGEPVASSREIEGEWDIVSFDGYEPQQRLHGDNRAAIADFGANGVALHIECNWSGASGRVVNGRFRPSPGDRTQTLMGCGPEREARDAALFGFFDRAPTVEKLADGRVRLRAGDTILLLQRPADRRLGFLPTADDLVGEWRLLSLTRYLEGNGYAGIGLSEVPGRIVFTQRTVGYSRCRQYDLAYSYEADEGRLVKLTRDSLPPRPVECSELAEPGFGSSDMPVQWDAMRVLHSNPLVEKSGEDTLLVSNGEIGLLITREPCVSMEQSDDHSETREVDCASPR